MKNRLLVAVFFFFIVLPVVSGGGMPGLVQYSPPSDTTSTLPVDPDRPANYIPEDPEYSDLGYALNASGGYNSSQESGFTAAHPPVRPSDASNTPQIGSNTKYSSPTTTLCGYTLRYCSVDLDSNGDNMPDCCNNATNPACSPCLDSCKKQCGDQGLGVMSCFMEMGNVACECSDQPPSCYSYSTTTIQGASPQAPSGGGGGSAFGFIIIAVIVVGSVIGFLYLVGRMR